MPWVGKIGFMCTNKTRRRFDFVQKAANFTIQGSRAYSATCQRPPCSAGVSNLRHATVSSQVMIRYMNEMAK